MVLVPGVLFLVLLTLAFSMTDSLCVVQSEYTYSRKAYRIPERRAVSHVHAVV
jgi:hypothetical protein